MENELKIEKFQLERMFMANKSRYLNVLFCILLVLRQNHFVRNEIFPILLKTFCKP